MFVYTYVDWRVSSILKFEGVFASAASAVMTVSFLGGAVAEQNAFTSKRLYNVIMDETVLQNVRIVRSSSAGFIISDNRIISFVPKDEVKRIIAVAPINPTSWWTN